MNSHDKAVENMERVQFAKGVAANVRKQEAAHKFMSDAVMVSRVAHDAIGQRRKYSSAPYWMHPHGVAQVLSHTVLSSVCDVRDQWYLNMMTAAYLHDVVEDTAITSEFIGTQFNDEVRKLVKELTKGTYEEDLSKYQRTVAELKRIAKISYNAKMIKVCDIYCNTNDIYGMEAVSDPDNITYLAKQLAVLFIIEQTLPPEATMNPPKNSVSESFIQLLMTTKALVYDRISKVNKAQPGANVKYPNDRLIMLKTSRLLTAYRDFDDKHISVQDLMDAYEKSLDTELENKLTHMQKVEEGSQNILAWKRGFGSEWTAK